MKLVFASDSFKGTISSEKTVELLTKAAHEVFGPCETIGVPVADGGEGTTDAVVLASNGRKACTTVHGLLMPLAEALDRAEELYYKGAVRLFRMVRAGMRIK